MKLLTVTVLGLLSILCADVGLASEVVKGPGGWEDERIGDIRSVTNGNAIVTIRPWQSLDGLTVDQWLKQLEKIDPEGGTLLSSEGVKPESVLGAFSVSRKANFAGEEGYSVLYGCPGQPGHARLMTFDVRDGGFVDTLRGALFGEKVCKKERA